MSLIESIAKGADPGCKWGDLKEEITLYLTDVPYPWDFC